jgi:hypothetical protein
MPKRSSRDINETAFSVAQQATGQTQPNPSAPVGFISGDAPPPASKNPHAQALGRLGGLKGGRARAQSLSQEKRVAIARQAANVRWSKPQSRRA